MFMCVCEIVATVATCTVPSIDGSPLFLQVYTDMRESLLHNLPFQAHADLESVDESLPLMLPAQVIHGVNDCVYTICRQTIQ